VVIKTIFACFALYVILPGLVRLLSFAYRSFGVPNFVLFYINPFAVMMFNTQRVLSPPLGALTLSWPLHCAIMIGGSSLFLALSTLLVRRVGLRQATGQFVHRQSSIIHRRSRDEGREGSIRGVKGPPVIWKQMKIPLVKGSRLTIVITYVLLITILFGVYGYCAYEKAFGHKEVQMGFVLVYFFLGLLRTATLAASSITSEKEARTWAILLATPLDNRQIVFGKIIGSCLRCWPFWLLLSAHVIVFSLARCIHPAAIFPLALLVLSSAVLVSAVGVFFSSCFKRTSPAAAINLILFFVFTVPFCCPLPTFFVSPFFVGSMILGVAGGSKAATTRFYRLDYRFLPGIDGFFASMLALIGIVIIYLLLALGAFAIANTNVRRRSY